MVFSCLLCPALLKDVGKSVGDKGQPLLTPNRCPQQTHNSRSMGETRAGHLAAYCYSASIRSYRERKLRIVGGTVSECRVPVLSHLQLRALEPLHVLFPPLELTLCLERRDSVPPSSLRVLLSSVRPSPRCPPRRAVQPLGLTPPLNLGRSLLQAGLFQLQVTAETQLRLALAKGDLLAL